MRPKALDLFCGAGGAAMGLYRAGFDVVGVDIKPQPRYPFPFVRGDALKPPMRLKDFDLVWASPPCQAFTSMRHLGKRAGEGALDLIDPVRELLRGARAWVIENVPGAPLQSAFELCGSAFGLGVRRHRRFESSFFVLVPECQHGGGYVVPVWGDGRPSRQEARRARRPIAVYGDHPQQPGDKTYRVNRARTLEEGSGAMGIDWMDWRPLTQAIPPAYSEHIGKYAMMALGYANA